MLVLLEKELRGFNNNKTIKSYYLKEDCLHIFNVYPFDNIG